MLFREDVLNVKTQEIGVVLMEAAVLTPAAARSRTNARSARSIIHARLS